MRGRKSRPLSWRQKGRIGHEPISRQDRQLNSQVREEPRHFLTFDWLPGFLGGWRHAFWLKAALGLAIQGAACALAIAVSELGGGATAGRPLLFLGVIFASWFGGLIGGLVSSALMLATLISYFYLPVGSLYLAGEDRINLASYVLVAVAINLFNMWRRHVEMRLLHTQLELNHALRVKDEFLSLVSHELRGPLTSIIGFSAMLNRPGSVSENSLMMVHELQYESQRLNTIIENMLSIARFEPGRRAELEPLLLPPILGRVAEAVIRQPDYRVVLSVHTDLPVVMANEFCVEQVMRNLLTNAQKYGAEHGTIYVTAEPHKEGEVLISVRDEGPGIPPAEAERIFEPFYRASTAKATGGIGIGLTVCQRLVDTMGGRLWLARTNSSGTCFAFTLRRAAALELDSEALETSLHAPR